MAPLSAKVRQDLEIKFTKGAAIGEVVPGSPAATAGLKSNDVIIGIDSDPVGSPEDVIRIVGRHKPGDHIVLQILNAANGHRTDTLSVILGTRPSGFKPDAQPGPQPVPGPANALKSKPPAEAN
jgi:serine protease Do